MGRTTPVEAIESQSKLQIISSKILSINDVQPNRELEPKLPPDTEET